MVFTALNVRIERAVLDPGFGDTVNVGVNVRLNEPIAIREDHRKREIVTGETLGLYNVVARSYLIYDAGQSSLRWVAR